MRDDDKTREQLIDELTELRKKVVKLETLEAVHRQTDLATRSSKERFRKYFELPYIGFAILDPNGYWLEANDKLCSMLQYSRNELKDMTWKDLTPKEGLSQELLEFQKIVDGENEYDIIEKQYIRKDGALIPVQVSASPVRDKDCRIDCFVAIIQDITNFKRAEEALKESEGKFRDLSEKAVAGVYLVQDNIFRYVNSRFAQLLEYTVEEMTDKVTAEDVIYPEDWSTVKENLQKRISGELESLHYEFRVITKNRKIINAEVYSSRTIYMGKPAVIGTFLDITERKRSEQRIIESEQLLHSILAASPVGIGKVRNRSIEWVNETLCSFSGFSQEELQGKSTSLFYESNEEFERIGKLLYQEGQAEARMARKDGEVREAFIQISPTNSNSYIFAIADITKQKRDEDTLRFTRFAMDRARDSILWIGSDSNIFYANDSACQSLGYSHDELLSMSLSGIDPLYLQEKWEDFWARIKKAGSSHLESIHKRKDGMVFPVEVSANFLAYGGTEYICAFIRDITERKHMEGVLRNSEERFHMLFESAGDAITILKDDIIVDCNEKTLNMFECTREQVIGQSPNLFSSLLQPDGRNSKEAIAENMQGGIQGKPQFFQWKFSRLDGTAFDAEVSLARIDIRGETYLQAIIRDVTSRKKTEEDLRRLSHAIEQAAEEVIITDTEGVIQYVNPAFEKITGYFRHEAIGQTPRIVKSGVHDSVFYKNLWDTIKGGYIWTGQITNRRKDGALIHEDATISPLVSASGQLTGFVSLKRDVTEEVKLNAQLVQAQKMEAIGTLAGGIAHDFNNILTVINGFGTLLQMKVEESNPLRRYIDQILSSSQKAANLIRSLLAFSRKEPITLSPINLNNTIKGTEKLLKRLLTEDIELSTLLAPEDIIIMADATQIDQILFNLATNARDAMKKGGKLTIETKLFNMEDSFKMLHGFGKPGTYTLLSVSDTGCGMNESTQEKIFDPFFTTKELGKGTGLGLSTVYGIVKQHNGYIVVSSEPNIRTTFSIYLPVIETVVKKEKAFSPVIKGGNETILIAEDDIDVRLLLKESLTNHGYKVLEAIDGQDAVEKFLKYNNIDLIVLDSVMPRKNGREVYDEIQKIRPLMKTIFMSGYTRDIVLDKGVEEKKVDFVSKPISHDDLLRKVREVLDR